MEYRYFCDGSISIQITPIYRTVNEKDWEVYDKTLGGWTACDKFWWADAGDNVTELRKEEVSKIVKL